MKTTCGSQENCVFLMEEKWKQAGVEEVRIPGAVRLTARWGLRICRVLRQSPGDSEHPCQGILCHGGQPLREPYQHCLGGKISGRMPWEERLQLGMKS